MNRFTTTMMISALGLSSQLANAAPPQDPPTVIVRFADLDLSHNQGVTVLYQRLKGAAETVCASQNSRDIGSQMRYKMCWQSTLGTAVAKVDRPALTAYYRAKFGGGNATIQIAQK
jgi:UrcA family protein